MARKTLESNSKRKAVVEEVDLTGDEVLSSLATKKKKSSKKPEISSPKGHDLNTKASKKPEDSKNKEKKVKFESPVKKDEFKKEEAVNESGSFYVFPMNRVTRIVKSDNSDIKLSAEAAFLFNKASEKFLELFTKEAYSCASKDGKKKIEYQHLSSVIPGNTRFDFLSDFVPAKVKVADALKEIPSVDT